MTVMETVSGAAFFWPGHEREIDRKISAKELNRSLLQVTGGSPPGVR
jgi:hypothetical protein